MERVGLLFDLDGTLLDTLEDLYLGANGALKELGLPPRTRQEVRAFVGNGARRLMELSLPGLPTDPGVDQALEAFQRIYGRICREHTAPYPGVLEALQQLRREGYPMAVVSNKPDADTKRVVAHFFPEIPWAVVRGQVEGVPVKPDPAGALAVAAEMQLQPGDFLYLGDTAVDMKTALAAGMHPVGARWGFRTAQELRDSGAAFVAETPQDVLKWIGM